MSHIWRRFFLFLFFFWYCCFSEKKNTVCEWSENCCDGCYSCTASLRVYQFASRCVVFCCRPPITACMSLYITAVVSAVYFPVLIANVLFLWLEDACGIKCSDSTGSVCFYSLSVLHHHNVANGVHTQPVLSSQNRPDKPLANFKKLVFYYVSAMIMHSFLTDIFVIWDFIFLVKWKPGCSFTTYV